MERILRLCYEAGKTKAKSHNIGSFLPDEDQAFRESINLNGNKEKVFFWAFLSGYREIVQKKQFLTDHKGIILDVTERINL